MFIRLTRTLYLFGCIVGAITGTPALGQPAATDAPILFGQSAVLDGPAAELGTGMRDGIRAAFAEANRSGGINGRALELISRDDGYDPNRSIEATRLLLDDDKVFGIIGAVGTPTSAATQPITATRGAPFIGAFTGAAFLRDARNTNVVNVRASYFQETEEIVERLTRDLGFTRIAVFYQDDAYGRAGREGVKQALARRDMLIAGDGIYERNTVAIKVALLSIRRASPQAVIMIGTYKPCAEFIKLARKLGFDTMFVNVSFVGSEALAQELGEVGAGVVVTQVVPFPRDTSIPLVARYQAALLAINPTAEPSFVSLEGYIAGRVTVLALRQVHDELTRQALLDIFHRGVSFDLDGMTLRFGLDRNFGSDTVFVTVLQPDGQFRPVSRLTETGG
jgi:ABC-type branched-subunit amino acid transport system substrate-binding protein